jgi:hypothetical protein
MKYLVIAITLLQFSCEGDITNEDLLPDASGEHGHILVIANNDVWEGEIGQALSTQLDQNAQGPYLRSEPMFNFNQKQSEDLTHVNKLSRLMLKIYIDNDSTYEETAVIEKENYYAKNQLFVILKDSDPNRMLSYIQNEFDYCINLFNDFELSQLIANYKSKPNKAVKEQAEKKFGISISLPKESKLKVSEDKFMWVKRDHSRNMIGNQSTGTDGGTFWVQEGIVLWSEPYVDTSVTSIQHTLSKRDSVLKYNIPGKVKGSYMATEYDPCCQPKAVKTTYKGKEAILVSGLWIHAGKRGAYGGGPFVQMTLVNTNNNEVVTVCCYVYAPKFNKREYIRELNAMLNTIEFVG